jgi:hypothetical protein
VKYARITEFLTHITPYMHIYTSFVLNYLLSILVNNTVTDSVDASYLDNVMAMFKEVGAYRVPDL